MKDILAFLVGIIAIVAFVALIWAGVGAIFYFGLPVLGVDLTFGQAVVLAILIAVIGQLLRGGSVRTAKEDD
jgi:hypothetical protein